MKRVILAHLEWGIYLGSCLGLGFWSQLDPCGQTDACTFPSEAAARDHVRSWRPAEGEYNPDDFQYVNVEAKHHAYATMAECVAAGQKPWSVVKQEKKIVMVSRHVSHRHASDVGSS